MGRNYTSEASLRISVAKITHPVSIPHQSENEITSSLAPLCVFFSPRGAAICFLIVGLLLTLTALFYLLGTALQMVCNDVGPPDYVVFREVTDKPSLWGGSTLIGAVTTSTIGLPINISLTSFLRYTLMMVKKKTLFHWYSTYVPLNGSVSRLFLYSHWAFAEHVCKVSVFWAWGWD